MRKSIVLLITLFFISAISILILKNLKDTDDYLNTLSYDSNQIQSQITMNNIINEVPRFLKKNKDNIDEILESTSSIPLSFGNIELLLNIQEYKLPQFNINKLTQEQLSSEDFINNINYQYDFLEIVKNHKKQGKYISNKQIIQTINQYIYDTKDHDILKIKDDFTFLEDINNSKLIKCNYILKLNDTSSEVEFIFDLNSGKIKFFTIL